MPERGWVAWLGRCLPEAARQDLFEPSVQDLRIARMAVGESRLEAVPVLLLFVQCWLMVML
jgi:hypothetical protein